MTRMLVTIFFFVNVGGKFNFGSDFFAESENSFQALKEYVPNFCAIHNVIAAEVTH